VKLSQTAQKLGTKYGVAVPVLGFFSNGFYPFRVVFGLEYWNGSAVQRVLWYRRCQRSPFRLSLYQNRHKLARLMVREGVRIRKWFDNLDRPF